MPRKRTLKLLPLDLGDETVGQRLAGLRKERGLTQVELAKRIGIIQVSSYERNELGLTAEMTVRFALALQVSTDEILHPKTNAQGEIPQSVRNDTVGWLCS
jgi:transcriptional regulator with XRE-family HTH domain